MRKYFKFGLLLTTAVVLLWWAGRNLDWLEVRRSMAQANVWWLAAATLMVAVSYLMRAYRWRVLLSPLEGLRLRDLFAVTNIGFSAMFLFGRAGEMVRPAVLPLRDRRVSPAASFMTIVVERICDLTASAVLLALSLLWLPVSTERSTDLAFLRRAGVLMLISIAVGLIALFYFRKYADSIVSYVDRRLSRIKILKDRPRLFIVRSLGQLAQALGVLSNARELVGVFFWTALVWIATIVATWLLLRAFDLPFGLQGTLVVMCWGMVGSLAPTPGGAAGAFHAATAGGLIFLGVTRDKAVAVAIVTHLAIYAPALAFGLYYFLRSDLSFKRVRDLTPHAGLPAPVPGLSA